MANVRLKVNMIIGGKNYPRDSVIDDQLVPERLKTEAYIASLEDTEGRVMTLARLALPVLAAPVRERTSYQFSNLCRGWRID